SLCLGLVGCASSNRKTGGDGNGIFMGAGSPSGAKKGESDPIFNSAAPQPDLDGMVAGTVFDSFNGRPVSARIDWVCLDDPKGEASAYSVETNSQGHYIIQGLKPGKRYKLVAKSQQDGRTLVGVKYTLTPNSLANIKLREETAKADGGGPPPPAPPGGK